MSHTPGAVKAVIFDLDDTLYDCSGTLVRSQRLMAAKVIARAIGCPEKEAYELQLELDRKKTPDSDLYEAIARQYSLPHSFLEDVKEALSEVSISGSGIKPFPGAVETLTELKDRGFVLFLVTMGKREEQEEKVHVLGLDGLFGEIAILDTSKASPDAKKASFKDILDRHGLKPEQVLCVGDRMDRELKVAKELGITTIMIKHGRHYQRFISDPTNSEKPDIYIENMADLPGIVPVKQPSQ
ncbi:MAG: HAD hydrolase-like protein [Candidatus Brocadiales bacterium]|nr:HAD hydrolase-like protein [Candidatus Bathyanammoxibius amoris]